MFKKILKFFKNVRQEMKNVTWPTKSDLKEGTTVVILMSIFVGIFLSVIDAIFAFLIRTVLLKS